MHRRRNPEAPTLYLDYDGVLHPDEVYRVAGKIVLQMDGFSLFEWAPLLEEIIAPHRDLQLVLSTTWVRVLGYDEARGWLPQSLQDRVVGATWHRHKPRGWECLPRHEQVLRDVERHNHQRWLAIDDSGSGWPAETRDRLVLTDSLLGLGALPAQKQLRTKLAML